MFLQAADIPGPRWQASGRFTISGNPSPWEIEFSLPRTCTPGLPALPALSSALVCLGLRTGWRDQLLVPGVEMGVSGPDQPLTKTQPNATLPESSSVEPHIPSRERGEGGDMMEGEEPCVRSQRPGSWVCLCHQLARISLLGRPSFPSLSLFLASPSDKQRLWAR